MEKRRLDQLMVELGLVSTRSQADSYIKLGKVRLGNVHLTKSGQLIRLDDKDKIKLDVTEQYVGRAGLKLESVASALKLDFKNKLVLDVGSSTGGFTDFSLRQGAKKVIAVDSGSNQMHPSLRDNSRIELHEKTDIRDFKTKDEVDLVLIDVSFISLRDVLPSLLPLLSKQTKVIAMVKPQFEAGQSELKHKGVIKNDKMRRQVLKDFESWAVKYFVIQDKHDSAVSGTKGNLERFYLMHKA
jgi:23S rRNA (cytidine1920-2'-O)/16S rRNA (cytidine1409-2'-O)-methyltransferase